MEVHSSIGKLKGMSVTGLLISNKILNVLTKRLGDHSQHSQRSCKLEIEESVVEQLTEVKYLNPIITSNRKKCILNSDDL